MINLDEAIKYYEKKAEDLYKAIPCDGCAFQECKDEKKQLTEWLKELKESRMVLDILGQFLVDADLDVCCEDLAMTDDYCEKYCDNKKPLCWYRWAKAKTNEVNADEDSN